MCGMVPVKLEKYCEILCLTQHLDQVPHSTDISINFKAEMTTPGYTLFH